MSKFFLALAAFLAFVSGARAQNITPGPQVITPLSIPGGFVSGRFYGPLLANSPAGTALGAANRLYALPWFVPTGTFSPKSLSFDISTGNASAWNARMCVYADNGSGAPGALVPSADTGTIAIASGSVTGVQTGTLTGVTVTGPAWYWVAFMADSASESLYSLNSGPTSNIIGTQLLGGDIAIRFFTNFVSGVFAAQTFGACPATFPAASLGAGSATPYMVVGF